MFLHYKTQAFVLREIERGESDKVFTVFTRNFGRLEILGKAIRKIKSKLRAGVPLFSKTEIEFIQGSNFKILTDASIIEDFENIKKHTGNLRTALKITEILNELIRGQERDEKIWQLFSQVLQVLNNGKLTSYGRELLYYYFVLRLLRVLGYSPHFAGCAICQRKIGAGDFLFVFEQRGLVCYSCLKRLKKKEDLTTLVLDAKTLNFLRALSEEDFSFVKKQSLSIEKLKVIKGFSEKYLNFIN